MTRLPSERFLQAIRPKNVHENWNDDSIYAETIALYLFARQFVHGQDVLDAACGYGYGSYLFAQTARRVVGVDLDEDSLQYATEHFHADNLEYLRMDVTDFEFADERFDVVVSIETLEHLPPAATHKFLDGLKRVLRPNGLLILTTPNRSASAFRQKPIPGHINEMTVAELRAQIDARFVDSQWYYYLWKEKPPQAAGVSPPKHESRLLDGFRRLKRLPRRAFLSLERRIRGGTIRQILRVRRIQPLQTQDDERHGLFQIVVARRDIRA